MWLCDYLGVHFEEKLDDPLFFEVLIPPTIMNCVSSIMVNGIPIHGQRKCIPREEVSLKEHDDNLLILHHVAVYMIGASGEF